MPYNKLPNTFLKLPDLGNIDEKPEEPYELPTLGMIHSSKFKDLCEVVFTKKTPIPPELIEQLRGHRLEGIIENIELDELADLIRHTLVINKSKIGWELLDEMNYYLDKEYTPRWELPDLEFDRGFRDIFISRINWVPNQQLQEALNTFFDEYKELTGSDVFVDETIEVEKKKIWSFKQLYIILNELSYLMDSYRNFVSFTTYQPLLQQLFRLFEENYRNKIYTIEQRIILIFLVVKASIVSGEIEISRLKILIDNSMNLINQLQGQKRDTFRLLYGFIYSIFWYNFFNSTSDLIMQRDLIAEIIEDIYKPKNMELETWAKFIISSKPHPLVVSLLLSGYERLIIMLYDYAEALPDSTQRDHLLKIRDELMDFLNILYRGYLEDYFSIKLDEFNFLNYYQDIEENIRYPNFQRLMRRLIIFDYKYKLIEKDEYNSSQDLVNSLQIFLEQHLPEGLANIEILDLLIRSGNYRYEYYYEAILEEFDSSNSIILSETFENEIIKIIGQIFSSIQEDSKRDDRTDTKKYEIMVLYVLNWMTKLYNEFSIRYESMMILSPLVSIAYIQLAKGYLEKGNLEAAFLSYFNSFYLMEMVNQELQGYNMKQTSEGKGINEKFQGLLKELGIEEFTDESYIKKLFRTIETSIQDRSKNRQDKSFSMGGMLDDDIVIGYLDTITQLETFNQLVEQTKSVLNAVVDSEIYTPADEEKNFRYDYYAETLDSRLIQQFPFPIVRNIAAASVSVKLYPIELKLPKNTLNLDSNVPNIGLNTPDEEQKQDE